jgi:hypothetical protein
MKPWIKLLALLATLLTILALLFGLYIGAVIGAVNIPARSDAVRPAAPPPSSEAKAQSQAAKRKIKTVAEDWSAFYLELTDQELTALLASRLGPNSQIRDLQVHTTPEEITFSGSLKGLVGVPYSGAVEVMVEQGQIQLDLKQASISILGVPGGMQQELESIINQAIDLDGLLRRHGATLVQQVRLEEGKVVVVGVQPTGAEVSAKAKAEAKAMLKESTVVREKRSLEPPGADMVPPGPLPARMEMSFTWPWEIPWRLV